MTSLGVLGVIAAGVGSPASSGTSPKAGFVLHAGPPSSVPPGATPASFPKSGPGTWRYSGGRGSVLGGAGPVERYQVAVESNIAVDPGRFAAKVDRTLGDPRSWIAGRQFRLQRVPVGSPSDFTIYLATERTSAQMCAAGGNETDGYTSCQTSGHVIINLDRWNLSVPDYVHAHVPLDAYRTYVINHETGHQFGNGHELCPAAGRPAPVMEQQTLGLHGCTANPWPYLHGQRYAGPSGQY
ncbi:DUF3152 domain-containing protein [Rugosimonospora acidiphila]|uniref:DUF3152 domain-containing protein n=1 Tax=Rugosimonospora acidiphila TaxID=556531 RepID=UPI0031E95343